MVKTPIDGVCVQCVRADLPHVIAFADTTHTHTNIVGGVLYITYVLYWPVSESPNNLNVLSSDTASMHETEHEKQHATV